MHKGPLTERGVHFWEVKNVGFICGWDHKLVNDYERCPLAEVRLYDFYVKSIFPYRVMIWANLGLGPKFPLSQDLWCKTWINNNNFTGKGKTNQLALTKQTFHWLTGHFLLDSGYDFVAADVCKKQSCIGQRVSS